MQDTTDREYQKKLNRLARKMGGGRNAAIFLENLAKNKQFYNALESTVGQELLKDCVRQIHDRLQKVINEQDDAQTRAELRAYLDILGNWSGTIEKYRESTEKLSKLQG